MEKDWEMTRNQTDGRAWRRHAGNPGRAGSACYAAAMTRLRSLVALGAAGLAGCAGGTPSPQAASTAKPPIVLDEIRISNLGPEEIEKLFEEATERLVRDDFVFAAEQFDKIVAADPKGKAAVPGLFNAGIAYHGMGKLDVALERFLASAKLGPNHPTTKQSWLRVTRIYGQQERWVDLEKVASEVLERKDLTVLERIEALGAKGLGLVEQGRIDEANSVIMKARDAIEDHRLGEAGVPPLELAQVSFALGEIRRLKSERITFLPFPPDFAAVLEDRCTQLLDAQAAYMDAMRSLDAHWSAMAGFRVGQLYHQLHRDVMQIPLPAGAKTVRDKQLWEGAMRLRYRILLEKGLKAMTATVEMGARTGESSAWVTRAKEAKKELETALALEKEALAKLPVTEEEIRESLEELRNKNVPKKP